jgi:GNAT superfamily N-acetyltransferase
VADLEVLVAAADAGLHPRIRSWVPDANARLEALREELEWWVEVAGADLEYARDYRRLQPQSGAPAERYLDRWLQAGDDLSVQAGPRYRSRDATTPFVGIVGANRPFVQSDLPDLRALAAREFAEFEPLYVLVWTAHPARHWRGTDADARLLAGRLGDLRAHDIPAELTARPLSTVSAADYERYTQMHAAHARRNPDHLLHTRPNRHDDLSAHARDGALIAVEVHGEWAGVMAARLDVASGMHGVTVSELILDPAFAGRGYGRHLSALLARNVPQPDERFLFGTIHADNLPAYRAARAAGREDVGGEVIVPLTDAASLKTRPIP